MIAILYYTFNKIAFFFLIVFYVPYNVIGVPLVFP